MDVGATAPSASNPPPTLGGCGGAGVGGPLVLKDLRTRIVPVTVENEMFGRCKHCAETVQRMDRLEADMRRARLDYDDLYEKARKLLSRLASRAKLEAPPCPEPESSLDEVSQRILARRNRNAVSSTRASRGEG